MILSLSPLSHIYVYRSRHPFVSAHPYSELARLLTGQKEGTGYICGNYISNNA